MEHVFVVLSEGHILGVTSSLHGARKLACRTLNQEGVTEENTVWLTNMSQTVKEDKADNVPHAFGPGYGSLELATEDRYVGMVTVECVEMVEE